MGASRQLHETNCAQNLALLRPYYTNAQPSMPDPLKLTIRSAGRYAILARNNAPQLPSSQIEPSLYLAIKH